MGAAVLLAMLAAFVALSGCSSGPTYDSSVREDTNDVTVPAGKGVEFKLYVLKGDRFDYSWTADRALGYDFHGDRAGDASGAFTSHKSGTAASDAGQLTAPFECRHGWWWENRGTASASVRLVTKGTYAVVGVIGTTR